MRQWINLCEAAISYRDYDLAKQYAHWNKVCFAGELPPVPVRWGVLKSSLGQALCRYTIPASNKKLPRRMKGLGAKVHMDSLEIIMNKKYVRTQQDFDAILIHEMIHIWLYTRHDVTTVHEGPFDQKRKQCEQLCGFPIPVSEKLEDRVYADDIKPKPLVVLIQKREGRETLYAVVSPSAFENIKPVIEAQWQDRGENNATLTAYRIETLVWMEKSAALPVQRAKALYGKGGVKFYYLVRDTEKYLDDLSQNGQILFQSKKEGLRLFSGRNTK